MPPETEHLTAAVPADDDVAAAAAAGEETTTTEAGDAAAAAANTDADAGTDDDAAALRAVAGTADADDAAPVHGIPKTRFDEVNEDRKAARAENAELRRMLNQVLSRDTSADGAATTTEAPKPRDFDAEYEALYDKYDSGDLDERQFRRESRKLDVAQAKAEMAAQYEPHIRELEAARQKEQQQRMQVQWTEAVGAAIKQYPFLNHEGKDANRDAIDAVRAQAEELIKAGIDAPKALRLAVSAVAPQYGTAVPPDPATQAQDRTTAARKAVAAAENAQPSQLSGVGNGVRTQSKQRLTASVRDHDKWEHVPEAQREQAFTA